MSTSVSGTARSKTTEAWKQWEGQVVDGKFALRRYLGGSDHSAVFLTDSGEGAPQEAAIKLIAADPQQSELQLSRWAAAANLSHPSLLGLIQMGRCTMENMPLLYLVMEYADEDLSQVLPQRPLTVEEVRDMLKAVLDALGFLHARGLVHGHLCPSNILAHADQLKITSDGLCRVGEPCPSLRRPTPYDAPELSGGRASTASDVWSLGMTLVETLTQQLPVWEPSRQAEPATPETLPLPFREIARNCLHRDPQRRWNVSEIAARLEAPARSSPTPGAAVPQPRPLPAQRKPSPRSPLAIAGLVVGLAVVAILLVPWLLNQRSEPTKTSPSASSNVAGGTSKTTRSQPATETTGQKSAASSSRVTSAARNTAPAAPRASASAASPSGGSVNGEVLQQVLPEVSQKARDTIQGRVRVSVRVSVDPTGTVTDVVLDSPGPSKYFAEQAVRAARRWEFAPAKVNDEYAASVWVLRFEFGRTDTRVVPRQTSP